MALPIVLEALRRSAVFRDIGPEMLAEIASLARPRTCLEDEVVVMQGDPGEDVFVIHSGYVKVSVCGATGTLTTLNVMGPGEMFGEMSLLDGGSRSATVTAMTRVQLLSIGRRPFLHALSTRPSVAIAIIEVLARRVRHLSQRSDDFNGLKIGSRLAKQMLHLAETHGVALGPDRLRLPAKFSQRDLGELVGATRESVNKHVKLWTDAGLLGREEGYVVITNPTVLRSIAEADDASTQATSE